MKRIFVMFCVAALAFVSCGKEDAATATAGGNLVKVTFSAGKGDVTRTVVAEDEITWEIGDRMGVYLVDENGNVANDGKPYEFKALEADVWSEFEGNVPAGDYTAAAAYYPYDETVTFDCIDKTFTIPSIDDEFEFPEDCGTYDVCYDYTDEPFTVVDGADSGILPSMTFKSLLGFVHVNLATEAPVSRFVLTAETDVFPRGGTLDVENDEFKATSYTNEVSVTARSTDFIIGLLPSENYGDVTATVVFADGFSAEKVIAPEKTVSNVMYDLALTAEDLAKKSFTIDGCIPDSDGFAEKYGYGTHANHLAGVCYDIDGKADPAGLFDGWYFNNAEIISGNADAEDHKFNGNDHIVLYEDMYVNNGVLCTAPIEFEDKEVRSVTVSFDAACDNRIFWVPFTIGVVNKYDIYSWADIVTAPQFINGKVYVRDEDGMVGHQPNRYEYTFEIKSGQRIAMGLTGGGASRVELAGLTITVE